MLNRGAGAAIYDYVVQSAASGTGAINWRSWRCAGTSAIPILHRLVSITSGGTLATAKQLGCGRNRCDRRAYVYHRLR